MQTMLNNFSWTDYFSVVVLLLLVYYVIVGVTFYLQEIKDLLSGKTRLSFRSASSNASAQPDEEPIQEVQPIHPELFTFNCKDDPAVQEEEDAVEQVRELTKNLNEVIAEAVEKNRIKEEFFLSLQLLLKKYSFLKGSPSMGAINNLIASECEKYGYIQLSAEERVMLWNE
jgi:hypothetical protein